MSDEERILNLEKRLRRSRVIALAGMLATVAVGAWGIHNMKNGYTPKESAEEKPIIASLESESKNSNIKIFQGSVKFAPNAVVYESPMMLHADEEKVINGETDNLQNGAHPDEVFKNVQNWRLDNFEKGDIISLYYPVVKREKVRYASHRWSIKDRGDWYGFKVYMDGDYRLYWLNGSDIISRKSDEKNHKFVDYDGSLPLDLIGQFDFYHTPDNMDNEVAVPYPD